MSPSSAVCSSRCWLVLVLWRSFFTATATGTMKTPIASTKNNPSSRLITIHDAKEQTSDQAIDDDSYNYRLADRGDCDGAGQKYRSGKKERRELVGSCRQR